MMNRNLLVRLGLSIGVAVFCGAFLASLLLCQETPESTAEATSATMDLLEDLINAVFTTSRPNPLTGEPVELTLTVEIPADAQLVEWPDFPEAWLPFEVSRVGEVKAEDHAEGGMVYQQTLTVYLWVPGEHETPQTLIGYQLADIDDVYYVPVRPLLFSVPSTLESWDLNELALKPNRSPVTFFYLPAWVIIVLVSTLVGVVWLRLRWLERRRLTLAARAKDIPDSSHGIALTALARLKASSLPREGVYIGVSTVVRAYVQSRFGVVAPDMTTAELVEALGNVPEGQLGEHLDELNRLLQQSDLVKFANLQPSRRSSLRLVDLARRWIISVDQPTGYQPEDLLDEADLK